MIHHPSQVLLNEYPYGIVKSFILLMTGIDIINGHQAWHFTRLSAIHKLIPNRKP